MNETIEIKLSNYQIEKATARLLHQHEVLRRLRADAAPRNTRFECRLLASMQSRLAKLLVDHESLLIEQGRADKARGAPWMRGAAKASYWLRESSSP